jgi:Na+(H+)/acetate symporter ActP
MLFLKRGNLAGALSGLLAGLAVVFFFTPFFSTFVKGTTEGDAAISFIKDIGRSVDTGAFALLANVAVFALVSLFTTRSATTGSKQA